MALETPPDTLDDIKQLLNKPYTEEELACLREAAAGFAKFQQGPRWPAGTLQRLLDWADAEDEESVG